MLPKFPSDILNKLLGFGLSQTSDNKLIFQLKMWVAAFY
jgi:hypothetical protein